MLEKKKENVHCCVWKLSFVKLTGLQIEAVKATIDQQKKKLKTKQLNAQTRIMFH